MSYISATTIKDKVLVWERCEKTGERIEKWYPASLYFYYDDENGKYTTTMGTKVSKIEFKSVYDWRNAKQTFERERFSSGITAWESDINPDQRVLMNHYYNKPAPKLHVTFYDIEVDTDPKRGYATIDNPYAPINSVSLYNRWERTMYLLFVPPKGYEDLTSEQLRQMMEDIEPLPTQYKSDIIICQNEQDLLLHFISIVEDSDLLCGYNSEMFDHPYVYKRMAIVLGEDFAFKALNFRYAPKAYFKDVEVFGRIQQKVVQVGKILTDYMLMIKKYEPGERESYKLASMEEEKELGLPKLEYEGSLASLYVDNPALFARYSYRDCEILEGFEQKLGYVEVSNMMVHMATGLFDHVLGTIKLHDLSLINYCHYNQKTVVPNIRMPEIDRGIQGAFVVETRPGLYKLIASIDLNSLYPTAIRSGNMSPEKIVGQFTAEFAAPEMFRDELWDEELTLEYDDGRVETKTVAEWKEILLANKWCCSGYGVVFDQNSPGLIPSVLSDWYATRKKHQRMSREADKAAQTLLANTPKSDDCVELDGKQVPRSIAEDYELLMEESAYHDRLQYIFKIKLNSLYGALSNVAFRFYDLRVAESTTSTGRLIEKHQLSKTSEILDGTYDAEGKSIIAGDTDSGYFLIDRDNVEDAIVRADEVAEQVNASFPEFMRRTFLCSEGYDSLMAASRELVMESGIWVKKKHYICRVADQEGKRVNYIKVMGLAIKKTVLPRDKAKLVEDMAVRMLDGEDWSSVSKDFVELKTDLMNTTDLFGLGLPKGVKGVEMYTAKWKADPTCRLPGHVAAAIHYNEMRRKYEDHMSPEITSGMKIKVFYLKGDHGRFKSMALPTDIDTVPQWFLDEFEVDRRAHIERLLDKPFENIIVAMGKRAPTRQSIVIDDAVEF